MIHNFGAWFKWVGENGGKFAGFSPEDFVEFQREAGNGERYEVLDLIQRYVGVLEGRGGYKKTVYSNIRSFFRHNRVELPQDATFRVRADKPKVLGTLTVEEIRDVIMSSNTCYRAVFTCMLQGGMGVGEILYWSENGWGQLAKDMKVEKGVIRVDLPGRKKFRNEYPYYTLLGSDSIEALRNWLKSRPEGATAIFTNQFGEGLSINSISMYWLKHLKRLGIIVEPVGSKGKVRYGKNAHEIRDVFRSQWEMTPAKGSVAEFMMGHQVDKLGYNKAHRDEAWVRK